MKEWKIKVYQDENCDFFDWRDGLPPKAKARFDNILDYLEITKILSGTSYVKQLRGYDGIYEIRFIVNNIQYRPLGCYGPERKTFVLLIGAIEQGDSFIPKTAPWKAAKRKSKIFKDRRYISEYY